MTATAGQRHILYELCVQRPPLVVAMLRSAHAQRSASRPRVLHEDFSGTAAISREWVATDADALAIATDLDPEALAAGKRQAAAADLDPARLIWREADVRAPHHPSPTPADVIFVGNFSIGELHAREDLLAYLRHARSRLAHSGVFICDTYGGAAAFRTGLVHRTHPGRTPTERILYTWEQRSVDPFTARVTNALHFRVELSGEIVEQHFDAFVYHWRLWSVPELIDAMREVGLFHATVLQGVFPISGPGHTESPAEHHIVCVAGWN